MSSETEDRFRWGFLASIALGAIVGISAYLAYRSFWIHGSEYRRMLVFGGPLLLPLATGTLLMAKGRRRAGFGALAASLLFAVASLASGFGGCTMESRPSIVVTVKDSESGADLTGDSSVIVRDGDFVANIHEPNNRAYNDANERPGIYKVNVSHPGFSEWERREVRVFEEFSCGHVKTVELLAELKPKS
ncbi:MAG TPA: hypothetical protein VNA87_04855 [Actinomycetota bacterium]|nr:hypothetical protein [Actinomycetota bacterium]